MRIRLLFLTVFVCVFSFVVKSQNTLLYLRYDKIPNDVGKLVAFVDSVRLNTKGRFVLYFNNKSYEDNEYIELVSSKDFLRYTNIYESELEDNDLSVCSEKLLDETVSGTTLTGRYDNEWHYNFVVSDNSSMAELYRLISVNSLSERLKSLSFTVYDDDAIVSIENIEQIINEQKIRLINF